MKFIILSTFLSFMLITLTGCESVKQGIREYNSRPVYGYEYSPLIGMEQKYSRSTSLEYCKAVTSGRSVDAYNNSLRESQKVQRPSEIQCRESFGTVTCKEKQPFGQTYLNTLQQNQNHNNATQSALMAGAMAMKSCMAQTGYVLKKVCVKNCSLY